MPRPIVAPPAAPTAQPPTEPSPAVPEIGLQSDCSQVVPGGLITLTLVASNPNEHSAHGAETHLPLNPGM